MLLLTEGREGPRPRPADGTAATQGAHGSGTSAMPSRRSAQGPKAGGGAAVQAAAALLHLRGTREGAGRGSKAATGSGAGLQTRAAAIGDVAKGQDNRNEGALWSPMEFAGKPRRKTKKQWGNINR